MFQSFGISFGPGVSAFDLPPRSTLRPSHVIPGALSPHFGFRPSPHPYFYGWTAVVQPSPLNSNQKMNSARPCTKFGNQRTATFLRWRIAPQPPNWHPIRCKFHRTPMRATTESIKFRPILPLLGRYPNQLPEPGPCPLAPPPPFTLHAPTLRPIGTY